MWPILQKNKNCCITILISIKTTILFSIKILLYATFQNMHWFNIKLVMFLNYVYCFFNVTCWWSLMHTPKIQTWWMKNWVVMMHVQLKTMHWWRYKWHNANNDVSIKRIWWSTYSLFNLLHSVLSPGKKK